MSTLTVSLEAQHIERGPSIAEANPVQARERLRGRGKFREPLYFPKSKPGRGNNRDIRAWLLDYKRRTGCQRCGEPDPACLDFHHVDAKSKNFTVAAFSGRELCEVQAEVRKCRVLCSNCHRKEHAVNLGNRRRD